MIIWVTGISGAGKTTVCEQLMTKLKPSFPETILLDGDVIRAIFGDGLGHKEPDRINQIKRIQRLATELERQGLIVLVAALYANEDLLSWNRENFQQYYEVYLDASLDLVKRRDPKGLYKKAIAGEMPDVVGIDVPWHAPVSPNLRIEMSPDTEVDSVVGAFLSDFTSSHPKFSGLI